MENLEGLTLFVRREVQMLDDLKIHFLAQCFRVFVQGREPNIFRMILDP